MFVTFKKSYFSVSTGYANHLLHCIVLLTSHINLLYSAVFSIFALYYLDLSLPLSLCHFAFVFQSLSLFAQLSHY